MGHHSEPSLLQVLFSFLGRPSLHALRPFVRFLFFVLAVLSVQPSSSKFAEIFPSHPNKLNFSLWLAKIRIAHMGFDGGTCAAPQTRICGSTRSRMNFIFGTRTSGHMVRHASPIQRRERGVSSQEVDWIEHVPYYCSSTSLCKWRKFAARRRSPPT